MPKIVKRALWIGVLVILFAYWQVASVGNMPVPAGEVVVEK